MNIQGYVERMKDEVMNTTIWSLNIKQKDYLGNLGVDV
jgi:hypothetical protein